MPLRRVSIFLKEQLREHAEALLYLIELKLIVIQVVVNFHELAAGSKRGVIKRRKRLTIIIDDKLFLIDTIFIKCDFITE